MYSQYTPIRNKLRKLSYGSVVSWCIEHLHLAYSSHPPEQRTYLTWELLLLLKWALANGSPSTRAKRNATKNDCARLLNRVKDLSGGKNPWLNSNEQTRLNKFLRTIAFQQFWTQRGICAADIGRHIKIFSELPCDYPIAQKFQEFTEFSLEDFFELAFATFSSFNINNRRSLYITTNHYRGIAPSFGQSIVDAFLTHLSFTFEEARRFSAIHTKEFPIEEQHLEQTPFILKPFLNVSGDYYLYSPHLLEELLRYHVYDILKERDGRNFAQKFGYTFEQYLLLGFAHLNLPFFSEDQLREFHQHQKVVDFLLPLPNITVLVESKAIEMAPSVRAVPTQADLAKSLKSSIIKAFKQIYSFASTLSKSDCLPGKIKSRRNFHALIVTYKELYFSEGSVAWKEFIQEEVEPYLVEEGIDPTIVDPSNIHFLCVEAWDKFVVLAHKNPGKAEKLLVEAIEKNQSASTARFTFEQHLDDYSPDLSELVYLSDSFKERMHSLERRFSRRASGE